MKLLLLFLFLAGGPLARAAEFPAFESDAAADTWLRANSEYYRTMATAVDHRTGYSFRTAKNLSGGVVTWEKDKPVIVLSSALTGAHRVSVLIFELTNCFQAPQHQEVDRSARTGKIKTAREFGVLHEIVELDGLRHHRRVLEELDAAMHGIPVDMFRWVSSNSEDFTKLDDYQLPYAFDYVKAQEASGHTQQYYEWFPRQARGGKK